jgi:sugar phosphate isomerase/epimerase
MMWDQVMDLSIVHPLIWFACRAGEGPIMETLPLIVNDVDFGAIEIAPPKDPAIREQARQLLASAQMQVVYLPILPVLLERLELGSADADERQHAITRLKELIDEAISFDSTMAMIQGPLDKPDDQREATIERLTEDIQELCDYAEAQSKDRLLFITFENFDRDVEKKRLMGPTTETVAMAEAVDRKNFGLTIDLSHLPLLGETPEHALQTARDHIIHAHIGNCVVDYPDSPLYGDMHPRFGHPLGHNDLPEVVDYLQQLNTINYWENTKNKLGQKPILTIELKANPPEEDPLAIIANGKRTFRRAWAEVNG